MFAWRQGPTYPTLHIQYIDSWYTVDARRQEITSNVIDLVVQHQKDEHMIESYDHIYAKHNSVGCEIYLNQPWKR